MSYPDRRFEPAHLPEIGRFASGEELRPQIAWHRANAHRIARFDHRLHVAGSAVFAAIIASSVLFVLGYYRWSDWTAARTDRFVFASSALPAIGTAIFGIRMQGDFRATAERSQATAERLAAVSDALPPQ